MACAGTRPRDLYSLGNTMSKKPFRGSIRSTQAILVVVITFTVGIQPTCGQNSAERALQRIPVEIPSVFEPVFRNAQEFAFDSESVVFNMTQDASSELAMVESYQKCFKACENYKPSCRGVIVTPEQRAGHAMRRCRGLSQLKIKDGNVVSTQNRSRVSESFLRRRR